MCGVWHVSTSDSVICGMLSRFHTRFVSHGLHAALIPTTLLQLLLPFSTLLLVQLVGPLLELLLARGLAQVLGDHGTGVGLVVIESRGTATGGLGVDIVDGV